MRIHKLAIVISILAVHSVTRASSVRCEALFDANVSVLETKMRTADSNEDYDMLLTFSNHVLVVNPNHPEALRKKAKALMRLNRNEEALQAASAALVVEPQNFAALGMKSQLLSRMKKYEEALAVVDFMLTIQPNNISSLRLRVELLFNLRRWDETVTAASAHLVREPDSEYSHIFKADALFHLQRFAEAEQQLLDALRFKPNYWRFERLLARVSFRLGKYSQVIFITDRLAPLEPQLLALRAKSFLKLKSYEQALVEIDALLDLGENVTNLITLKIDTLIKLHRLREAERLLIQVENGFFKDYYSAQVLIGLKQYGAAIVLLKNLDLKVNVRWFLAKAYFLSGDMQKARLELIAILQNSKSIHFGAIAALMAMKENGDSAQEMDALLNGILQQLSLAQLAKVKALKDKNMWDYEPASNVDEVSITNSFWNGLYSQPRNQQSFNSSYGTGDH